MTFRIAFSLICFLLSGVSFADVEISGARVKSPIPGQMMTAGYFVIKNTGEEAVTLVDVASPNASDVSLHAYADHQGMMMMVGIESLVLEPGEEQVFAEGGLHLMIANPDENALASEQFKLEFVFANGSQISVLATTEFLVAPSEDSSQSSGHHHH